MRPALPIRDAKRKTRRAERSTLRVARAPGNRARGILRAGSHVIRVALGRAGIKANKFEGDGATPLGQFRLLRLWWRADRTPRPRTHLPARQIHSGDAWCEDPADRRYNRPIHRAPADVGDRLWRDDHLYDLLIELDHNTRPRVARRGSAVFVHVARPGFLPTAGCVALDIGSLQRLLERLPKRASIKIE